MMPIVEQEKTKKDALISYEQQFKMQVINILLPEIMRDDQRNTPVKSTKYVVFFHAWLLYLQTKLNFIIKIRKT